MKILVDVRRSQLLKSECLPTDKPLLANCHCFCHERLRRVILTLKVNRSTTKGFTHGTFPERAHSRMRIT